MAVLFGGLLPSDAQLDVVRAAIDEANLTGDDTRVVAPRVITVVVAATITGTAVTTDVEDAILAWWRANISIGAGVSEAALHAGATAGVAGITSSTTVAGGGPAGHRGGVVLAVDQRNSRIVDARRPAGHNARMKRRRSPGASS